MNEQLAYSWYEQYATGIFRFALSILKEPQGAEDVLQEVFLRLLSRKNPPPPEKAQAWLYRVARNICYDILRKRKQEAEPIPDAPAPAQDWEFIHMIAPLSETEQQIVSLRFIGGFSHKEIATILGLTVHGAKKRYERAITKLRNEMEERI